VLTTGHLANQAHLPSTRKVVEGVACAQKRWCCARERGTMKRECNNGWTLFSKTMRTWKRERESNTTEREVERITRGEKREERRHSCRHVSSLSFSNKGAVLPSRPVAVNRETRNFCEIQHSYSRLKRHLSYWNDSTGVQ